MAHRQPLPQSYPPETPINIDHDAFAVSSLLFKPYAKTRADTPSKSPLKVQVGIRDLWNKADSDVQKQLKALHELLGYEVVVDPEWPLLLTELEAVYPDKGVFVAAVAGMVTIWCKAMGELLEDEENEEWTEGLLERLKESYSRLKLFLEVRAFASVLPLAISMEKWRSRTTWSEITGCEGSNSRVSLSGCGPESRFMKEETHPQGAGRQQLARTRWDGDGFSSLNMC